MSKDCDGLVQGVHNPSDAPRPMFALIYQAEGGFERHVETWGHELGFSPTCRAAFAESRLAPLENIRFDDSHTQVPPGLELSTSELAELRGEVARVAAERPWTNHRGWMGKVLDRAAARREASLSGEGVGCEGSKL